MDQLLCASLFPHPLFIIGMKWSSCMLTEGIQQIECGGQLSRTDFLLLFIIIIIDLAGCYTAGARRERAIFRLQHYNTIRMIATTSIIM